MHRIFILLKYRARIAMLGTRMNDANHEGYGRVSSISSSEAKITPNFSRLDSHESGTILPMNVNNVSSFFLDFTNIIIVVYIYVSIIGFV